METPLAEPAKDAAPAAEPAQVKSRSVTGELLRVAAFPVAALAGLWAANTSVRGAANQIAVEEGSLKPVTERNEQRKRPLIEARLRNEISKEEFRDRYDAIRNIYRRDFDEGMEFIGRGNFLQKFRYIRRSQAQKAMIDGMTVAGITLGVMLTVADSQSLSSIVLNKEKDKAR